MAPLMSVACKSWDLIVMGGLEQASPINAIFLYIVKAKAHWRAILTCYLKNWVQKNKDKWSFDRLSWKRWTHSMMKRSISRSSASCTFMAIGIKWCPSWSVLYLWILTMVLSFTIAHANELMTFEATISRVRLIATTSTTKTWSSWVM